MRFAEMTRTKGLTTKAELWRQFWPFRPRWHRSVRRIPGSNVNLSALTSIWLGLEKLNQTLGNWSKCPLLIRTKLPLEASGTFKMITTTRHSALEQHCHILAPFPPDMHWCCHSVEQTSGMSDDLPSTHRAGTPSERLYLHRNTWLLLWSLWHGGFHPGGRAWENRVPWNSNRSNILLLYPHLPILVSPSHHETSISTWLFVPHFWAPMGLQNLDPFLLDSIKIPARKDKRPKMQKKKKKCMGDTECGSFQLGCLHS